MQLCNGRVPQAPAVQQRQAAVRAAAPCRMKARRTREFLPVRAAFSEPEDFEDGRSQQPMPRASFQAQQLYSLLDTEKRPQVGSYNGEGFVQYFSNGPSRVDVETLNDQMRPAGALRLRHAQHPHEAFGMVFNFDGVVADLPTIKREAWVMLAQQLELPLQQQMLQHPELQMMPPEVAVVRLLRWANDRRAAIGLAMQHAELAGQLLQQHNRPLEGVREWLDTLGRFNVPCALVSGLDRSTVQAALARMTLHDHFQVMVTAEDELETISQRLLTASVKLGRAPNMCVYFDSSPPGITAAHNVTFKAVAVQGIYRPHQLKNADITCSSLQDLSVINMRRLFANMGSEFMDLQKQAASQRNSNNDSANKGGRRRRIANAMMEPDE
eukprot:GHRQ01009418.1.p1 GENE.GHRQ01009418.1~~GHRQ01009418.1.p1  ORF type:complete len:383 (+),score=146.30 GHRQ01009418.1:255-1403(+)